MRTHTGRQCIVLLAGSDVRCHTIYTHFWSDLLTHQYTIFDKKAPNLSKIGWFFWKFSQNTPNYTKLGAFISPENPPIDIPKFGKKHPKRQAHIRLRSQSICFFFLRQVLYSLIPVILQPLCETVITLILRGRSTRHHVCIQITRNSWCKWTAGLWMSWFHLYTGVNGELRPEIGRAKNSHEPWSETCVWWYIVGNDSSWLVLGKPQHTYARGSRLAVYIYRRVYQCCHKGTDI